MATAAAVVRGDRLVQFRPQLAIALAVALRHWRLEPPDAVVTVQFPEHRQRLPHFAQMAIEIEPAGKAGGRDLRHRLDLLNRIPPRPALEFVDPIAHRRRLLDLPRPLLRTQTAAPVGKGHPVAHLLAHQLVRWHAERLAHRVVERHLHPAVRDLLQADKGVPSDKGRHVVRHSRPISVPHHAIVQLDAIERHPPQASAQARALHTRCQFGLVAHIELDLRNLFDNHIMLQVIVDARNPSKCRRGCQITAHCRRSVDSLYLRP